MIDGVLQALFGFWSGQRRSGPDLARFPDLPPCGYDAAELDRLRAAQCRLETPQYRTLQRNRERKENDD